MTFILKRSTRIAISLFSISFIFWIIYMADTGQSSIFFDFIKKIPYGDKVGHFFIFGCVTLLANVVLRFRRLFNRKHLFLGTSIVALFALIEEISQMFFATRTFDLIDLTADSAGILLFHWLSIQLYSFINNTID
ncbi:MAG: VanZ family protein [Flavobacteriales bacterium]